MPIIIIIIIKSFNHEPTFVLFKVQRILLVCDNLMEPDYTVMVQLPEDLDLSDCCDWKALFLIVRPHLLQCHQLT